MEPTSFEPFDIESLNPTYHELTLTLPAITAEQVSVAMRGFSYHLTKACGTTALDSPELFAGLIVRTMLMVSGSILKDPEAVLKPLRTPENRPWTPRRVTLLAPSAEETPNNHAAVLDTLCELGASDEDIERLFWMVTVAVAGSLATIGRLPMQEVPSTDSYH
ncbi:hypothetical protein [Botrimarina mediterranea]|nr:hypothetical protein [Botrimarina mediterranea]